ncbi:hypothetical protein ACFGVR_15645 [Mucilaginibacter sp. AW1-3]
MSRLDRVVFFSKHDQMGPHMLGLAEKLLDQSFDFSSLNLNALLEFHHIWQYFENDLYLERWTAEQKVTFNHIVDQAMAALRDLLLTLPADHFFTELNQLELHNRGNFWLVFRYFEIYKKIDRTIFTDLLTAHPRHIRYILPLKQLVQHYDGELKSFLLTYEESAELLLAHYEEKITREPLNYYFPKSLSDLDKHTIISTYLDSSEPNWNYVDLIKNSKHLKLPPKILLKAKQTAKKLSDRHFTEANSIQVSVSVSLALDQDIPAKWQSQNTHTEVSYGGAYLDTLKTDTALFTVFHDLFDYTDQEGLITLVSKDAEMDTFEKILMQSKNKYSAGIEFGRKDLLSLAQLSIMQAYLSHHHRSLEELIENFVTGFFKIEKLTFKMPDAGLSPSDKIRLLAPEMEYLLKQYKNFVADGLIDHELLQLDSTPIFYSEIPSLVRKKYVSSTHQTIHMLQNYFFDPNSVLSWRKGIENRRNVFGMFLTERVMRTDFEDYQQPVVDHLLQTGYLKLQDGELKMKDTLAILIAGKLRKNGHVGYWHCDQTLRATMDRMIAEGMLTISNHLFTSDEVSYFNFYLNKKEFSNGKDLRNKYLHGSNDRDAKRQKMDYLYFLRTFILILLKLKEDVSLDDNVPGEPGT